MKTMNKIIYSYKLDEYDGEAFWGRTEIKDVGRTTQGILY